ncbi:MAG: hypothetical protein Q4F88_03840 [Eubacteriales bacterium]|nr:hypothetical protein [Eubacteriales bacterium]
MKRIRVLSKKYKFFIKIYLLICFILIIFLFFYIRNNLIKYEKYQIENFLPNIINEIKEDVKNDNSSKYFDINNIKINKYEKEEATFKEAFLNFCNQDITYEEINANEDISSFQIYSNGIKFYTINLNKSKKKNVLLFLNFTEYELQNIKLNLNNGFFQKSINCFKDDDVFINGNLVDKNDIKEEITYFNEEDEAIVELSKYTNIPKKVIYEENNFLFEPEIKINAKNNILTIEEESKAKELIKEYPNILNISILWSRFMIKDLNTEKNGYYEISKYIKTNSLLDEKAFKWATGPDITYINSDIFKNTKIENEKIYDFEIYNDEAFSASVFFEKNYYDKENIKTTRDTFKERLYFYYEKDKNAWKLVSMKTIIS